MGSTYETDSVCTKDSLTLSLLAAATIKSLANLINCKSWLAARISMKAVQLGMDELTKTVKKGSE